MNLTVMFYILHFSFLNIEKHSNISIITGNPLWTFMNNKYHVIYPVMDTPGFENNNKEQFFEK